MHIIKNIMETIKSRYAIITTDKCISLYNDKTQLPNISPLWEDVFENVTITFNDNNSITLDGDCWQWGIEFDDEYPNNFDYEVHPNYIKLTKFRKKPIVRHGWHRKKNNKHITIIMSDYKIVKTQSNYL